MIKIKIYLRTHSIDTTTGIIWFSFYIKKEKVNFSSRVSCLSKNWSDKTKTISQKEENAKDKNLILDSISARINDVAVRFRLKNKQMTRDSFLRAYNRPSDFDTFHDFYSDYDKRHSYKIEGTTWETHRVVMNKLKEYDPNLHFDDIDSDWLDQYYSYLRKDLKNNENTSYKNMSILRKSVNAAFRAGYFDENPFKDWKIKRGKSSYMYLKEEELTKFIKYYQSGQCSVKHYSTLELFLFSCYTSLSFTEFSEVVYGDLKLIKLKSKEMYVHCYTMNVQRQIYPIRHLLS